jgi:hypothetical protein
MPDLAPPGRGRHHHAHAEELINVAGHHDLKTILRQPVAAG